MSNGEQTQFNPQITPEQTRHYIGLYDKNPGMFPPEQLELIRQHAQYHNIPFYEGDFGILDAIKQFAGGFIEGFTTLNILVDGLESISKSLVSSSLTRTAPHVCTVLYISFSSSELKL